MSRNERDQNHLDFPMADQHFWTANMETGQNDKLLKKPCRPCYGTSSLKDPSRGLARRHTPGQLDFKVSDWMSALDDESEISALSIPGTHDSAAFTYGWPYVSTQRMDILKQLDAGIRYFDLRCGLRDDILEMVHGNAYLGLELDSILDNLYIWLEAHPREALVLQLKRDHADKDSKMAFSQAVVNTIARTPDRWRLANTTPCLGELRGKIQLFRRFTGEGLYPYGINVYRWQDNSSVPFTIHTWHGVQITVQDHYAFSDPEPLPSLITKKDGNVSELLNRAAADKDGSHWYINYSSSLEFNIYYQCSPYAVAVGGWWAFQWIPGLNVRMRQYFSNRRSKRRYGIVAMDFPETPADDLIAEVVRSNFEPTTPLWEIFIFAATVLLFAVFLFVGIWKRLWHVQLGCSTLSSASGSDGS